MSNFRLNEPAVSALHAALVTNLPTAIDTRNTEIAALTDGTEGFTLDQIDTARIFDYIPVPSELDDYPAIGIQDARSVFQDDTGWAVTGLHELVAVVYCMNAEPRALAWQLRRMTQVVARVALDGRRLGEEWGTGLVRIIPGDTLGPFEDPRTWMSFTGVHIWCKGDDG